MTLFQDQIIYPFTSDEFIKWWNLWKEYKKEQHKFKYKSIKSEQAALMCLSEWTEQEAIESIKWSMGQGWKGIFKKQTNGQTNQIGGTADAISILTERHGIR